MKYKHKLYVFIVAFSLIINSVACSKEINNKIEHRRQSWLKDIGWDEERQNYSGKSIRVAVVDSGVDSKIAELNKKVIIEKSVVKENKNNDQRHGTAVASIIAAESHSKKQVEGIAPDSSLISIDVTNQEGGIVDVLDLAEGINEAVNNKVDIINVSVGCIEDTAELKKAVERAIENDIIVVASAGNYTKDNILYPSKYEGTISVGALNKKGEILYPKEKINKNILYFPGENIVTAIGEGDYCGCDGTSFSNAICTGLIALLLEKNNDKESVKKYLNGIDFTKTISFAKIIDDYK